MTASTRCYHCGADDGAHTPFCAIREPAACVHQWVYDRQGSMICNDCDEPRSRPLGSPRNEPAPSGLTVTLTERGKRYGPFHGHAQITQALKHTMAVHPGWHALAPDQKEALEMIAHKTGRILNGDPNYDDSWVDIAGYAQLVADRLQGMVR